MHFYVPLFVFDNTMPCKIKNFYFLIWLKNNFKGKVMVKATGSVYNEGVRQALRLGDTHYLLKNQKQGG